jgi:Flp pilus assembly protein TadG
MKRTGGSIREARGLLSRLLRDTRGNVLMLTAAMLIPLCALVGSGIDLGRIYVTRSRMQVACDAASLAGRRAVSAGLSTTAVQAEAIKFFNYNFPQLSYGSAAFVPTAVITGATTKVVTVSASTTLPMAIMQMFGNTAQTISVTCNAQQDFVNTDVVLVLDTTGSMACDVNGNNCNSGSTSKIVGLRAAVMALYDQLAPIQAQLNAAGLRMRIGIVPYSSAVNVGGLIRAANTSYLKSDTWTYQSRKLNTVLNTNSTTCSGYSNSTYVSSTKTCTYFTYSAISQDISSYVSGGSVNVGPIVGTTDPNDGSKPMATTDKFVTWPGCIEERQTTRMSATATSIDANAEDLDINLIPSDDNSRWKPYWPEVEYTPSKSNIYTKTNGYSYNDNYKPQYACPAAAAGMQWWARSDLQTYVNSLTADGGTYHDNGMRWGMRLASPGGIFGGNNPNTFGNMPVKRYIIFMTDGLFDTGYSTLYTSYGVEQWDARVTPGGNSSNETDQLGRHQQRFDLLCSAAKSDPFDYNIWVVGFAQALDTHLTNCASNPGQASTAADSTALYNRFVEIGKNIGALRLTQ